MGEWKIYTPTTDIDGSVIWHVDGDYLKLVSYHSIYNLYKFYEWDGGVRAMAMEYDAALSILADYFEAVY
jgi:hypothetical protein